MCIRDSPHCKDALASKEALEYWSPVDWYNGGMEHTTLHLSLIHISLRFQCTEARAPPLPGCARTGWW